MIDLDELEAMEKAATPGPWDGVISSYAVRYLGAPLEDVQHGDDICGIPTGDRGASNKRLIAAVRNALPELIAELRALRQAAAEADIALRTALMWAGKEWGSPPSLAWAVQGVLAELEQVRKEASRPKRPAFCEICDGEGELNGQHCLNCDGSGEEPKR